MGKKEDQRWSDRIGTKTNVTFTRVNEKGPASTGIGQIINLSPDGLRMHAKALFLKDGDALNLQFKIPAGREGMEITGMVLRIVPYEPEEYVSDISVVFLDLDEKTEEIIKRFVRGVR